MAPSSYNCGGGTSNVSSVNRTGTYAVALKIIRTETSGLAG